MGVTADVRMFQKQLNKIEKAGQALEAATDQAQQREIAADIARRLARVDEIVRLNPRLAENVGQTDYAADLEQVRADIAVYL